MRAEELKYKYEKDLAELQETCLHENISDWIEEQWAPAHGTGYKVKQCNDCWKITERQALYETVNQYIITTDDNGTYEISQ